MQRRTLLGVPEVVFFNAGAQGRRGNESMQMANSGKVDGINSALLDSAYDFAPPRYKISGFRHRLQGAVCNHGFTQGDAALTLG